jgi:hypothetical protein
MIRPAIQQWGGHYIGSMRMAVVALAPRQCLVPNWPTPRFDVDDFAERANLSLRSIDGLVVVDNGFPMSAVAARTTAAGDTRVDGRP